MRSLGKLLQLMGLIVLPVAMLLELTDTLGRPFGVSDMVTMLVFGIAVFFLGRLMEGYAAQ
jgi:hypothetical protein